MNQGYSNREMESVGRIYRLRNQELEEIEKGSMMSSEEVAVKTLHECPLVKVASLHYLLLWVKKGKGKRIFLRSFLNRVWILIIIKSNVLSQSHFSYFTRF